MPDYRGEVCAVLFNFGNEYFVVNMGDRIARLIFERIKTPERKEMDDLEGTNRGAGGYGSTGTNVVQSKSDMVVSLNPDKMDVDVNNDAKEKDTLSHSRQLITAEQMSKLAKGDHLVFLAIIRETNEAPPMKKSNKRSSARAVHALLHPTACQKEQSSQLIRRKARKRILFWLLSENSKFSTVFLYVTGKNWVT